MQTKVLLVFDTPGKNHDDMVAFLGGVKGYHVVPHHVQDANYASIPQFVKEFEAQVTTKKREYALCIFHLSGNADKLTTCLVCESPKIAGSRLLKHAFASAYIRWGAMRCALVYPDRCCSQDACLPPAAQMADMAIPYETKKTGEANIPDSVWEELSSRLETLRKVDSYKSETAHITAAHVSSELTQTTNSNLKGENAVVAKEKEDPATLEDVLRAIDVHVKGDESRLALAQQLGMSALEWQEHSSQVGRERDLSLVLRREAKKPLGLDAIAKALTTSGCSYKLSDLCRSFDVAREERWDIYLSDYIDSGATNIPSEQVIEEGEFLGGKNPNAPKGKEPSEDTHVEHIDTSLLPPYMRDAIELELGKTPEERAQIAKDQVEYFQKLDKEYEDRKLKREMQEYQGQLPLGSTLIGGYATREHLPGKIAGGVSSSNETIPK